MSGLTSIKKAIFPEPKKPPIVEWSELVYEQLKSFAETNQTQYEFNVKVIELLEMMNQRIKDLENSK